MMAWIKCTDRPPPDMEPVIVTVKVPAKGRRKDKERKEVWADIYLKNGVWMYDENDGEHEIWDKAAVTHWMPWPEPAED